MTFENLGLEEDILRAIKELGFEKPMPIQEKIIPTFLKSDTDLIGLAQTGTGKTAAFGLPLIQNTNTKIKVTQAVVLSPTRELCIQIANDLSSYSKYKKGLRVTPIYGGADIVKQMRLLAQGTHIIVATPGRLLDILKRKKADISKINSLVLDEADEMLNFGFKEELDAILKNSPDDKKTYLFSATLSKPVARIATSYMKNPVEVSIGRKNEGASNVTFEYYQVDAKDKYEALKRIIDINPDIYSIVFCRTRRETKDISAKLLKSDYNADALHGDLSQAQRDLVMGRFRNKHINILVATDVAARGLDVNNLTHVINYNLPDEAEAYTHRSGRTGRAGKKGTSIAIIHSREKNKLARIERVVNRKFERREVPSGNQVIEKQLFNHIARLESASFDDSKIKEYLPAVYSRLEWMSKEELINKFIALKFSVIFSEHSGGRDLNSNEKGSKRGNEKGVKRRKVQFAKVHLNTGSKFNFEKRTLMKLVNSNAKTKGLELGIIDVLKKFTFFEVDKRRAHEVVNYLSTCELEGRKLVASISQESSSELSKEVPDRSSTKRKPKRKGTSDKKPYRKKK